MHLFRRTPRNVQLALPHDQALGLSLRGRMVVLCVQGTLWVTAPQIGDVVLRPDQSLTLTGRGRVVIQALESARFGVET